MAQQRQIRIDHISCTSLMLQVFCKDKLLGTATGFAVRHADKSYLVTNWHVVAGKDPETGRLLSGTGAIPDEVRIAHHHSRKLGAWIVKAENLYGADGRALWLEHPKGREVDVVAIPLTSIAPDVQLYPIDLALAETDVQVQPAMPVSIIGYPFGLVVDGAWPIWKTGHVASDPDLYYQGKPAFIIDATTREGMSGSPVVLRVYGGYHTRDGGYVLTGGQVTRFLGVYAGRIHDQVEIGRVWRPELIPEILRQGLAE